MNRTFDSDVKVGELRIFADLARPVVALIAEDRGAFGFRIIPVSDFTSVSCEGEQLFGNRVYQFWNTCSVPRSFASRSWIVDTLSSSELSTIRNSSLFTLHSALASLSPYQRTYLFSVPAPLGHSEKESSQRTFSPFTFTFSFRRAAGLALAACFVLALVFAIHFDYGNSSSARSGEARTIRLARAPVVEPLEAGADEEEPVDGAVAAAEVPRIELEAPKAVQLEPEPEVMGNVETIAKVKPALKKRSAAMPPLDKYDVARMEALPLKTTDDRAVAVMTYVACGVKGGGHGELGRKFCESVEELQEYVRTDTVANEYTRRLVATALCRAYVATQNPELKASAETMLNGLGDKRSVAIVGRGYDLIEDWLNSQETAKDYNARGKVALPVDYPDWFKFLKSK